MNITFLAVQHIHFRLFFSVTGHQEILDLRYDPRRSDFQKPGRRLTLSNNPSQRSTTFQPHPPMYSREHLEATSPASPCWSSGSQSSTSPRVILTSMENVTPQELLGDTFDGREHQHGKVHTLQGERGKLPVKRVFSLPCTDSAPSSPGSCRTPPYLTIGGNTAMFQSPLSSPISPSMCSRSPRNILPPINYWMLSKDDSSARKTENDLQSNTPKQKNTQDIYGFPLTSQVAHRYRDLGSPRAVRKSSSSHRSNTLGESDKRRDKASPKNESKRKDSGPTVDNGRKGRLSPQSTKMTRSSTSPPIETQGAADNYTHKCSPRLNRKAQTANNINNQDSGTVTAFGQWRQRFSPQPSRKVRSNTNPYTDVQGLAENRGEKERHSPRSTRKSRSKTYSCSEMEEEACNSRQQDHLPPSLDKIRSSTKPGVDLTDSSRHKDRGSSQSSGKPRSNTYTYSDASKEADSFRHNDRNVSHSTNEGNNHKKKHPHEKERLRENSDDKKQEPKTGTSFFPSILHPKRWTLPKLKREKCQPSMLKKSKDVPVNETVEVKDNLNTVIKPENDGRQPRKSLYSFEEFLKLCEEEDFNSNENS